MASEEPRTHELRRKDLGRWVTAQIEGEHICTHVPDMVPKTPLANSSSGPTMLAAETIFW